MTDSSPPPPPASPLELWGGVECAITRAGDAWFDQLERTGHDRRDGDLERFAGLGLRTLRYPVLWERVAPRGLRLADWSWADRRLGRLRELGIEPVVGLLHRGGGPGDTSLVDPSFPTRFAAYARAFAERYPWVEAYAPIDSPLLTARRSGLEGRWHPHGRDPTTFARALLNQCRAVALAMAAVRRVNPKARLVQTEVVGHVRSTPALAARADFENEYRWLTFDLLAGRVVPGHPIYAHLVRARASPAELDRFTHRPCPPDLFGLNYQAAGERYFDERAERYPASCHAGGGGRPPYADVEAVRVCAEGLLGPSFVLREASRRYGGPLALTEVYLAGTPDERMRWLVHAWREARFARGRGADVRAVTAWALLGAYAPDARPDAEGARYEPGAFAVVDDEPRPGIVTEAVRALAAGREPEHRVLGRPGWWQRPDRLRYGAAGAAAPASPQAAE